MLKHNAQFSMLCICALQWLFLGAASMPRQGDGVPERGQGQATCTLEIPGHGVKVYEINMNQQAVHKPGVKEIPPYDQGVNTTASV